MLHKKTKQSKIVGTIQTQIEVEVKNPGKKCERTLESDDLGSGVHDGRVGGNGPAGWLAGIRHLNDNHLVLLADLLADANKLVRLHGQGVKPDAGGVDAHIRELSKR